MPKKKPASAPRTAAATSKRQPRVRQQGAARATQSESAAIAKPRARQRKAPAKSPRWVPDPRSVFKQAMTIWLDNMKYQVGLSPKDFKAKKEVAWANALATVATTLVSTTIPLCISGGGTSEETFPVLLPFVSLADLVGFQVKAAQPTLLLVIFADNLSSTELRQRFEQFLQLAEPLAQFGLRLNGTSMSMAVIYPLLVYFNERKHTRGLSELLADGFVLKPWEKVNLIVGFVNVPGGKVTWSLPHGATDGATGRIRSFIAHFAHIKPGPFDDADLANVRVLASNAGPDRTPA